MCMSIDIIIVNWNAGEQLHACLQSIKSASTSGFRVDRVVVVDNGSNDGSLIGIESLSLPIKIIRNSINRGFGAACNQGAEDCESQYVLFLNPVTILYESSLVVPLTFMNDEANKNVGICGIQLVDENRHITRTCARFPNFARFAAQSIGISKIPGFTGSAVHMADWDHSSNNSVDHVIGAFYLIRRSVFETLKGFDERFFVYLEDIDLSYRANELGWQVMYLTGAQAFHAGGGTSRAVLARRLFYSLRSRLLFGFKHFPLWQAWVLLGITLIVEPLSRSIFSLLRGGLRDVNNTWSGYCMLYRDLPHILPKSSMNSKA